MPTIQNTLIKVIQGGIGNFLFEMWHSNQDQDPDPKISGNAVSGPGSVYNEHGSATPALWILILNFLG
jgi:hypothetical protein